MASPLPTIRLKEPDWYVIWLLNYNGQLRQLHEELVVEDENGNRNNFQGLSFEDFSLLVFQERRDLIDERQKLKNKMNVHSRLRAMQIKLVI